MDSTNALPPCVACVTNIDLEHTEILGSTREAIAFEKASIAKPGGVLVSSVGAPGDPAAQVVRDLAEQHGARFVDAHLAGDATIDERNLHLARALVRELGLPSAPLDDPRALDRARLPGRLERAEFRGLPVVLDGAHVASSLALVLEASPSDPRLERPPTVLFGARPDKDLESLVGALANRVELVLAPRWDERTHAPASIVAAAKRHGIAAQAVDSVDSALELAGQTAAWLLVTGSLHFVGAVRPRLRELQPPFDS